MEKLSGSHINDTKRKIRLTEKLLGRNFNDTNGRYDVRKSYLEHHVATHSLHYYRYTVIAILTPKFSTKTPDPRRGTSTIYLCNKSLKANKVRDNKSLLKIFQV